MALVTGTWITVLVSPSPQSPSVHDRKILVYPRVVFGADR